MQPSREVNYFRIGTFVIIGMTILIICLLLLGSGLLFKRTVYIETYFSDTIQGLSEGSPVKYRGLEIGHVKKINFVNQMYKNADMPISKTHDQYIYVEMAITSDFLAKTNTNDINKIIQKDIKKGLRVKLALQGLTGNAYLEIDFLDPKSNKPLKIDWTPDHYYIPSATSTLTRFSDNVQYILEELKKVKFNELFTDLNHLIKSSDSVMNKADNILTRSDEKITNTINNLQNMSESLRKFAEHAKTFPSHVIFGQSPPKLDPGAL